MHPLWKTVWRFLKLKIELPYDPVIAQLGIYPNDTKILIQRDICTPMFLEALFIVAKLWEQPKCPSIDNRYIHTTEYYSAIKKNEILPFAMTWMDIECIMLSEISKIEKDKYHMISLICGI